MRTIMLATFKLFGVGFTAEFIFYTFVVAAGWWTCLSDGACDRYITFFFFEVCFFVFFSQLEQITYCFVWAGYTSRLHCAWLTFQGFIIFRNSHSFLPLAAPATTPHHFLERRKKKNKLLCVLKHRYYHTYKCTHAYTCDTPSILNQVLHSRTSMHPTTSVG